MKALRFGRFGSPAVLAIEEVPMPKPGAGEALVRMLAVAVNPSDVKNVAGFFAGTTLPRTPGRDFCGWVEGKEVWGSAPGFGMTRDGVHAEYAAVPVEALAERPANVTREQAAAIGVPFLTAWAALVGAAGVRAGETVLMIGAGGAVGQAAIQIARWKGARVLGAERGAAPIPGVEAAIDTEVEDLPQRVRALTAGAGAEVVFDAVGGAVFEAGLRSLARGGRQVAIASGGEARVSFNLVDFYHNRSRLIGVDSNQFRPPEIAAMANALNTGFMTGALEAPAVEASPFSRAVEVFEALAAGRTRVKQVLTFS